MSDDRDFNDPRYKKWRAAVRRRSGHRCVMCGARKRLQTHHIRRYADDEAARFLPENGVALCRGCHERVTGSEADFEGFFSGVARKPSVPFIEMLMRRYGPKDS